MCPLCANVMGVQRGVFDLEANKKKTTNEAAEITASATNLVAIENRFKIGLLQTTSPALKTYRLPIKSNEGAKRCEAIFLKKNWI